MPFQLRGYVTFAEIALYTLAHKYVRAAKEKINLRVHIINKLHCALVPETIFIIELIA